MIVSFAVAFDGATRKGFNGEELFRRTTAIPEVDAVGFNCVSGPRHLLEYVRGLDLGVLGGKALSVMPNARYPTVLGRHHARAHRPSPQSAAAGAVRGAAPHGSGKGDERGDRLSHPARPVPEALDNLKLARQVLKGKILGGIYPVISYKNACFLHNEIAGVRICPEIIALYEEKGREEAEELAVTISQRVAGEIAPYTDGLYLMASFRRVVLMARISKRLQK